MRQPDTRFTLFPYTTLFRSARNFDAINTTSLRGVEKGSSTVLAVAALITQNLRRFFNMKKTLLAARSEEHTSELQSRGHLVCRLLLEKKKQQKNSNKNSKHH